MAGSAGGEFFLRLRFDFSRGIERAIANGNCFSGNGQPDLKTAEGRSADITQIDIDRDRFRITCFYSPLGGNGILVVIIQCNVAKAENFSGGAGKIGFLDFEILGRCFDTKTKVNIVMNFSSDSNAAA